MSGTPKKQSSIVVVPLGSWTSAKPPPAGPVSGPSVTNAAKRGAEQRVDRVPTVAQDARAGLGRQWMTGCDSASHPESVLRLEPGAASRR